ncbi:hypothetical protein CLOP_g15499 [Closterium sp. NIES-67]|nr:hypothetical protein CLOP_g15499 [Closterium sp. NIES-67]
MAEVVAAVIRQRGGSNRVVDGDLEDFLFGDDADTSDIGNRSRRSSLSFEPLRMHDGDAGGGGAHGGGHGGGHGDRRRMSVEEKNAVWRESVRARVSFKRGGGGSRGEPEQQEPLVERSGEMPVGRSGELVMNRSRPLTPPLGTGTERSGVRGHHGAADHGRSSGAGGGSSRPARQPMAVHWEDWASDEEEDEEQLDAVVLEDIYFKVKAADKRLDDYKNLVSFLCFIALYMVVLYMQADSTDGYEVSTAHNILLPSGASGSELNSMSGPDEMYQWVNDSIIQVVWEGPHCGNSVCDNPLEYAAFGRFGCEADCGVFENVTHVVVHIHSAFASQTDMQGSSWNLCMAQPTNLCWFEEPQGFSELHSETALDLFIPDGDWQIKLDAPGGGVRG